MAQSTSVDRRRYASHVNCMYNINPVAVADGDADANANADADANAQADWKCCSMCISLEGNVEERNERTERRVAYRLA